MKIPSNILTLIAGIVITLISLWYGQNHGLMPVAASSDAKEVDNVFNLMMTIATGLFLLVEGVILYCVIRFRRRKGDQTDGPPIAGNVPLEILWTAIPTIIVFIIAVYSFEIYNNLGGLDPLVSEDTGTKTASAHQGHSHQHMLAMAPRSQVALGIGSNTVDDNTGVKPLVVNVKGIQYAWIFSYPETGIMSGELHAPVNRPVQLNITAGDVIHAVWIPQLRLKQDAIPGRDSTLVFKANVEGQYPIICAELCGSYHGGMKSMFYAQTEEEFNQWVKDNAPAKPEEASEAIAQLNPANLSDSEFLTPYAEEMGIEAATLAQLKPVAHSHGTL